VLSRISPLLVVLVLAAACGQEPVTIRAADSEAESFFTQVVDFEQDVGAGLSLSTDAEGNPHLSFLGFEEQLPEGEEAPPPVPGAATLPAVKHAHILEDTLTRTSVAGGREDLQLLDDTAIWVDEAGTHHIAWTEGGVLYYTDNPEGGDEAKPQQVSAGPADGISISADADGAPWISFYEGGQVQGAFLEGKRWTVETVAPAEPRGARTTAIRVAGDEPLVAYGDGLSTMLALRDGGEWTTETVPGAGGLGVGMALDVDGNPHLAYYDQAGEVKHAHDVGQGWEVSDVGNAGAPSERGGVSIVLDAEGVHHVAWQAAAGIGYANNLDGDFVEQEVPRSDAGVTPALGVGPEEGIWLAWWDQDDTEVQLALRSEEEPLLALPSPQPTLTGGATPAAECQPEGAELEITAPSGAASAPPPGFDKGCLAMEAGQPAALTFNNDDSTIHNFAIYTASPIEDPAAEHLGGSEPQTPVDPGASETYDIDIQEPGNYYFQCDFHVGNMSGTFVVAEAGGGGAQGGGGGGG
jgi:plastocyanin